MDDFNMSIPEDIPFRDAPAQNRKTGDDIAALATRVKKLITQGIDHELITGEETIEVSTFTPKIKMGFCTVTELLSLCQSLISQGDGPEDSKR
jgi:hypothetical protein